MTRRNPNTKWRENHKPDELTVKFAKNLREVMKKKRFGNLELSNETGFSEQSVSNWTNGRHLPDPAELTLLSQVLEEPLESLLGVETSGYTPARIIKQKRDYRNLREDTILEAKQALWLQIRIGNAARDCFDTILEVMEREPIEVRLLICDTSDPCTKVMLERRRFLTEDGKEVDIDQDSASTVETFQEMANITGRKLSVMRMPFLPSYVAYIVDPELDSGKLLTAISGFERRYFDIPSMIVTKASDKEMFKFYVEQYEALWQFGKKSQH